MFVATKVLLRQIYWSQQKYACCNKRRVLSQETRVCRDKHVFVSTKLVATKMIFVAMIIPSLCCAGIGRGLVYAPSLIIVGMYFNRHRGLGVGLATAGVGAGTFVLPPLVEWLFQHFGFQGAFLIMGAVALNSCIVAALYRPLFVHRNIVLGGRIGCRDEEKALCSTARDEETKWKGPEGPEVEIINDTFPTLNTESRNSHENDSRKTESRSEVQKRKLSTGLQKSRTSRALKSAFSICFPTEVQKKDAPKRKLIEWSLLKNPAFLFYCFNICLFTAAFKSAFTFLPALAESQGMSPTDAAFLLSISGILDTFGRIMAGFILDIRCIRPFRPVLYNSVIFVITGVSFVSPYLKTFGGFAVLFGLYGMLTGTYASQKSVILVDILGQEKLSSSFGLMICFQGLGTCIGPPLSGISCRGFDFPDVS